MYKKCYNSSLQCMDLYDTQNNSPDFSLGGGEKEKEGGI